MKFLVFIYIAGFLFIDGFAQSKRFNWDWTEYEKIQSLIDACHRKEYANCYHLAEIYLSESGKQKKILSQHTEDRIFALLEITDEEKLKKLRRNILRSKSLKKIKKLKNQLLKKNT